MFERSAGQPAEDDRLPGASVFEDAENFDVEILDLIARENGLADAVHAGANVLERQDRECRGGWQDGQQACNEAAWDDHYFSVAVGNGAMLLPHGLADAQPALQCQSPAGGIAIRKKDAGGRASEQYD